MTCPSIVKMFRALYFHVHGEQFYVGMVKDDTMNASSFFFTTISVSSSPTVEICYACECYSFCHHKRFFFITSLAYHLIQFEY